MATNRNSTAWNREDRDLLIELKTEMTAVRQDIRTLKDDLARRVQHMEISKLDKAEADARRAEVMKELEDVKKALAALQRWQLMLSTLAGAAGAIITAAINLFSGTIKFP